VSWRFYPTFENRDVGQLTTNLKFDHKTLDRKLYQAQVANTRDYKESTRINLISLGTLEKEGFIVKLQSGKVKVINGSRVVLSGIRRDNCVYSLDGHAMVGELNASVEEIDYVHSDLWGPFQVESLGVENQTRRTVKRMRTDNGLEFREFKQLCIDSGIARHLTVVGTPQQNGLVERMNRTLMDKVRCLLIQSGLPKTFWAEATCTAAYLINRSPSTVIEKKTPMEIWSGHPSDYGMLRIFGCVAYLHDKQGKLEPRAIKCVLLGYPDGVKGYILYGLDDESPKIVTSRNVVFNESVMYKDSLKDSGAGADKSIKELQEEDTHEPLTYQEAVACEDSSKWKAVMKEEMDSLRKNKTWELVDYPAGKNLVLREVTGETTVAGVWSKLETLHMTKSLANKLYLKKKLYTFYMSGGRKIFEHIDEFNKIVLDLTNIEVKFKYENLALLLLTYLPASYEHFVDTFLYGREALTLEDVMATLNSKEIKERCKAKGDDGEGLYVRGRTDRRDSRQSRGKSRSRSLEVKDSSAIFVNLRIT
ncbi:retrovirus-related pol polyprotein from transposon TNT 1-94, partial [Tanacetum coccineum]